MNWIYITQLLCPQRHAILAIAFESDGSAKHILETEARFKQKVGELVERGLMNPRCALCGSQELAYETARSVFHTMKEAIPFLRACERAQASLRAAAASRN